MTYTVKITHIAPITYKAKEEIVTLTAKTHEGAKRQATAIMEKGYRHISYVTVMADGVEYATRAQKLGTGARAQHLGLYRWEKIEQPLAEETPATIETVAQPVVEVVETPKAESPAVMVPGVFHLFRSGLKTDMAKAVNDTGDWAVMLDGAAQRFGTKQEAREVYTMAKGLGEIALLPPKKPPSRARPRLSEVRQTDIKNYAIKGFVECWSNFYGGGIGS